ncbi:C6 transcription factor [Penicillium macrosclerotiorum]|uniref:C6 transcription factor n=1 Tax=Penicillium macrosclerotiorum TaxID=303699 RepID=UPI002547B319|nr:C6 transcription factor [Penicillium macrosclerotiorum]KAJ5664644.1 C6 transcription factor [Penicillium macrosclerotiorum]
MLQSIASATGVSTNKQTKVNLSESLVNGEASNYHNPDTAPPSLTDAPSSHSSPSCTINSSNSSPSAPPPPLYDLDLDEAGSYLERFMNHMIPCFPFITILPGTTIEQLRRDRPFLLEAIIAVATTSTQEKLSRVERLKYNLTKASVLENQSSVDILLGILTYIAWSTDPFLQRSSNLSRMMMMAMSLVYDLQLGKPPPSPEMITISKMTPGLSSPEQSVGNSSDQGMLEKQRAVLACFVLSSIISSSFRRIVPLRWDSQMESAIDNLEKTKACQLDENFAIQVRLQVLAQKASHIRDPHSHVDETKDSKSTPFATSMYLKVLQGQLQELRAACVAHLPRQDMLTAQIHYAELCINEVTRLASSQDPLLSACWSDSSANSSMTGLEHLESLWRSVYAVKSWLDAFYTIPPGAYIGFPFFFWFQLVRCVVILKHLLTFDDPAWDREAVRNTVNMVDLLEWMTEKTDLASQEAGEQSDDDLFRRVNKLLRMSHQWVMAKQGATTQEEGSSFYNEGPNSACNGDNMIDLTDMPWMNALEFGDGTWLEEVLGWSPMVL